MALSVNQPKLDNLAGEIWKSADRLRGRFKAYEDQLSKRPKLNVTGQRRVSDEDLQRVSARA